MIQTSCSKMIKIICKSEKTTQQVKRCTIVSLCMWSEQHNQEETESLYQAKQDKQSMIIGMSMYRTYITMKHRKSDVLSLNQDIQSYQCLSTISKHAPKLPMCNQETGSHWSTHQMPCLLHLKFKLDPPSIPSGVAILWTPLFSSCVFHSMASSILI